MSVAVTATGEVVDVMSHVDAERITARIADKLDAIADNLEQVMPLIAEALTRQAWKALGYISPQAYVEERFKGALTRLPREVRRTVVAELSAAGMSTRAIAPIVGTDQSTIVRDLGALDANASPEPARHIAPIVGASQKTVSRDLAAGESYDSPDPDPQPAPGQAPAPTPQAPQHKTHAITGRDGKTYQRPKEQNVPDQQPPKRHRKPLPDAFWTARYDLGKKTETLHRLTEDDRFPTNKKKVAEANLNDLLRCRDLLQQVIDQLT